MFLSNEPSLQSLGFTSKDDPNQFLYAWKMPIFKKYLWSYYELVRLDYLDGSLDTTFPSFCSSFVL